MMNRTDKIILYIAAVVSITGCAKTVEEGVNVADKRFLDAWMHVNHPGVEAQWKGRIQTGSDAGNGIYVIENHDGPDDAVTVTDNGYAIVEYTVRDLNGNITAYTSEETAKKLGTYSPADYYGPKVWMTLDGTIQAGLQDAITGMKAGGSRTVIIPSWLMSYSSYDSAKEYLGRSSDYSTAIYEFTVKDFTDSIDVWQRDSIERYIVKEYGSPEAFTNDTTGFYFRRAATLPEDAEAFPSDTSIYINYTGKLLNGLVFDTTSERTAKDENIYDASRTYEPVKINWSESASGITMGTSSSSTISGFAMTLWRMRHVPDSGFRDKATGIFFSPLGYGYSGSGSSIPGYAPLIFEIEIVDNPEN